MKINRIEHERRESAIARDIGDDAAGKGEQHKRAVDEYQRFDAVIGHIRHLKNTGIGQVD